MGWCHEFGSQIRHGCDHPMAAGTESCSCPGCGIRCTGRFASCDVVWDRGPRQVLFVRPVHDQETTPEPGIAPLALSPAGPTMATSPLGSATGERDHLAWLATSLEGVRSDLRALREVVAGQGEALGAVVDPSPPARLAELVERLPERIGLAVGRAVSRALREQGRASPEAPPPPAASPAPVAVPPAPATSAVPAAAEPDGGASDGVGPPAPVHDRDGPAGGRREEDAGAVETPGGLPAWEALRARLSPQRGKPTSTG